MSQFIPELHKIAIATALENVQIDDVDDMRIEAFEGQSPRDIVIAALQFSAMVFAKFIRETEFEVETVAEMRQKGN
jgi:hypothetical protein